MGALQICGSGVSSIGDNQWSKLTKKLQMLGVSQSSAARRRSLRVGGWEAHCKDYLQVVDAKAQSGAILALLTTRSSISPVQQTFPRLQPSRTSLMVCTRSSGSEHHEVLQSEFERLFRQPGESINDFQQALRFLGRRAFPPTPQGHNSPEHSGAEEVHCLCPRPSDPAGFSSVSAVGLDKALTLAREEEFLLAACN
ncbi:unnamed protein product [Schistocephalus solidus]|uniref:Uncharacterized protein n=1 Tax=Schistocephalus solidus TaxID=70667 RepID=A0A3P7C4J8_SCHSO|nr:unnamed protein product [Schistocephalus solidus]